MEQKKRLIIIGGGAAGLSAAAEAAEAGAYAIVLENNRKLGGNGMFAEVMFGLNTKEQENRGIECDLNGYFALSMEHSHYKNNGRLLRNLLEGTKHNVDWLLDHGLQIVGMQEEGAPGLGAATHYTEGMHTGSAVMKILRDYCEASEYVEIHTGTNATALVQDDAGNVTGVRVLGGGAPKTYTGDGVIIACGGFSGNRALIQRINPTVDVSAFGHLRGIQMPGTGILLAEQAGGEILKDGCFENAGPTFLGDGALMALVTKRYAIWLNQQGRRFVNEGIGDNFVFGCNAVYAQPGHFCYVLLDQGMVEEAMNGPVDFLAGPTANAKGMSGMQAVIEKEIRQGNVCLADDIAGLAAWMGISAENLEKELMDYNDACAVGTDKVFLKPKHLLKPVEKAPFLCIRCGVDYILTHGGIRVDEDMQVLRKDGSKISGLFAAGADISGIDAAGYQVSMGGHSFGFALTGGRIAAKSILNQ